MIHLTRPFIWIAVVGLIASVIVHSSSILGLNQPFGPAVWWLHGGIFIVWFPAVLVGQRLSKGVKQSDVWKAVLRGCPTWMKRGFYILFPYALINFILIFALGPDSESDDLRLFSGHWMLFYFAGMAMLYSATRIGSLESRTCQQGHEVSPFAKFCDECGSKLPPVQNT